MNHALVNNIPLGGRTAVKRAAASRLYAWCKANDLLSGISAAELARLSPAAREYFAAIQVREVDVLKFVRELHRERPTVYAQWLASEVQPANAG
jgi:hypothetical protein